MDKFTVRDSNGSVDVAASVTAYSKSLNDWVSINETPVEIIEKAVEAVFDSHTSRLPIAFLVNLAVQEMKATPEQYQALSRRVNSYVKGQIISGRFDSTKGKGTSRLARLGEPIPVKS